MNGGLLVTLRRWEDERRPPSVDSRPRPCRRAPQRRLGNRQAEPLPAPARWIGSVDGRRARQVFRRDRVRCRRGEARYRLSGARRRNSMHPPDGVWRRASRRLSKTSRSMRVEQHRGRSLDDRLKPDACPAWKPTVSISFQDGAYIVGRRSIDSCPASAERVDAGRRRGASAERDREAANVAGVASTSPSRRPSSRTSRPTRAQSGRCRRSCAASPGVPQTLGHR
jgi:hypothetical protein